MSLINGVLWFGLISAVMILAGCAQSTPSIGTLSNEPATPLVASMTPGPSLTPLPSNPPTLMPTAATIPTLPVAEARARLLSLLADNGSCQLPCLWGITPGTSLFQDARIILAPLSSLSYTAYLDPPGPGAIDPKYLQGDFGIHTSIRFLSDMNDGVVRHIAFSAQALKETQAGYDEIFDSQFFGEQVRSLMLPTLLSEQGAPSEVLISTLGGPPTRGGKAGFDVLVLYPNQGILAHYTTGWQMAGENVVGCLASAHVELELFPSGKGDSFAELLAPTKWANLWPAPTDSPHWKPVEEATSMSLEEFYQTFRQPTDKCVETPVGLWPVPEP